MTGTVDAHGDGAHAATPQFARAVAALLEAARVALAADGAAWIDASVDGAPRAAQWLAQAPHHALLDEIRRAKPSQDEPLELKSAGAGPSELRALACWARQGETRTRDVLLIWSGAGRAWSARDIATLDALSQVLGELLRQATVGRSVVAVDDATDSTPGDGTLRKTAATLANLIEASPMAIYTVDRDHRVRSWNGAAERIFGWSAAEVIGRPLPIVDPSRRAEYARIYERVLAGESMSDIELTRTRKDGSPIQMNLWVAPLPDERGHAQGVLALATDVTARRKMEAELLQAQRLEAVGRLAGGVAHDFNNLLTAIMSYAQFVRKRVRHDEDAVRDLDELLLAARRAASLTQQLLTFSRRDVVRPRSVLLQRIVEGLVSMLGRLLPEGIRLVPVLDADTPPVRIDPGQAEQLVVNLALNARDAMPDGGALRIEVAPHGGAEVALVVRDEGVGIDESTRAHMFDPFFTTKGEHGGSGLGLATVQGIVERAGGRIEVDSTVGSGSTFSVYLPMADRSAETRAAKLEPPAKHVAATILLLEDSPAVAEVSRRALEAAGHRVLVAENADEAARIADGWMASIDVLVSDVVLPGARGPEVFRRLSRRRPDLRVLFMTGYAGAEERDALGNDSSVLRKPFSPEQLAQRVAAILAGHNVER